MSKIFQKYHTFPLFFGLMFAKACTFDSDLAINCRIDVQHTLKIPYFFIDVLSIFNINSALIIKSELKVPAFTKIRPKNNGKVWCFQSILNIKFCPFAKSESKVPAFAKIRPKNNTKSRVLFQYFEHQILPLLPILSQKCRLLPDYGRNPMHFFGGGYSAETQEQF